MTFQVPLNRDRFRRPELLFFDFLRKGAQGLFRLKDEVVPFLFRAEVLAVDTEGGNLENPTSNGSIEHVINGNKVKIDAKLGPNNPANSIKARVLTDGLDKFSNDENLKVFWPFFPESVSISVKPGEHVYVVFEDSSQTHGLWLTKVPGHEDLNFAEGSSFYTAPQTTPRLAATFGATSQNAPKIENPSETPKPSGNLKGKF